MKCSNRNKQSGFMFIGSIMGIVVGLLLVSIVVGPIWYYHYAKHQRAVEAVDIRLNAKDAAREGLYRMIMDIGKAEPSQVLIGEAGDSLTLIVPEATEADEIQYTLGGTSHEQLIRTNVSTGESRVLAEAVDELTIYVNGHNPAYVTVKMNLMPSMPDGEIISDKPFQLMGQAEVRAL